MKLYLPRTWYLATYLVCLAIGVTVAILADSLWTSVLGWIPGILLVIFVDTDVPKRELSERLPCDCPQHGDQPAE